MQDYSFDERDLRLLHALQIRPRAPWATLAPAVGADPVTLARRWESLQEQGLAWISSYAGSGTGVISAILEIECSPSSTPSVTEELAKDPEVQAIVSADRGIDYGDVMHFVDLVKSLGVNKFALSTEGKP